MQVPRSLPDITSPKLNRYPRPSFPYALRKPSLRSRLRARISSQGIQTHNASLTISAGCMVNTFLMPIQPLLPLTSTPSGVSVNACSIIAPHSMMKLILRYTEAGTIIVSRATANPTTQNPPCFRA